MGRPRLHDQATERDLLAAAERLLSEGGPEALSVRRLAEAAQTTPRAIYSVFGGMDGLTSALFREAFRALSAGLDAMPETEDPEADLIAAGVIAFRGWASARPQLFKLAFDGDTSVRPADSAAGVEAFARLRARVARCIDAGLIAPGREAEVALAFHSLCEGLAGLEARGRFAPLKTFAPEAVWRSAMTALVRGYLS